VEGINAPLVPADTSAQRSASAVGPATGLRAEHPTAVEVRELPSFTGLLVQANGARPVNRRLLNQMAAALSDDDSSVESSV
jgi:hypothetical protein